jgi:hypothetical protein
MLGVGWEPMVWEQYRGRLLEAEKNRLVWQSRVGQRRSFRLLARVQKWLESYLSEVRTTLQCDLRGTAKEATTGYKTEGSLIL